MTLIKYTKQAPLNAQLHSTLGVIVTHSLILRQHILPSLYPLSVDPVCACCRCL